MEVFHAGRRSWSEPANFLGLLPSRGEEPTARLSIAAFLTSRGGARRKAEEITLGPSPPDGGPALSLLPGRPPPEEAQAAQSGLLIMSPACLPAWLLLGASTETEQHKKQHRRAEARRRQQQARLPGLGDPKRLLGTSELTTSFKQTLLSAQPTTFDNSCCCLLPFNKPLSLGSLRPLSLCLVLCISFCLW